MRIRVLGSAAGGGFPQWNCNCKNCAAVRRGDANFRARTQSSIAVTGDGKDWFLVNASPDLRAQIAANPQLHPLGAIRHSPIAAVMLMDGQIDHCAGLLLMRERATALPLYATAQVQEDLTRGYPLISILAHYSGTALRTIDCEGPPFTVPEVAGIHVTPLAVAGRPAPYSPHRMTPRPGDNLGVTFTDEQTNKRVFYAPGLASISQEITAAVEAADCVMLDGTFFHEDEMHRAGTGQKRAQDMGHLAQSGSGGMIEFLQRYPAKRKILIHINNTNPILNEAGAERAQLDAAGIEVAYDGMEIAL